MITSSIDTSIAKSHSNVDKLHNFAGSQMDETRADQAASEFEEMMFGHLVKYMFETTEGSALWGEGHGADIMRSMFIEAIAKSGGASALGIRDSVKKNLYANTSNQNDYLSESITTKSEIDVTF